VTRREGVKWHKVNTSQSLEQNVRSGQRRPGTNPSILFNADQIPENSRVRSIPFSSPARLPTTILKRRENFSPKKEWEGISGNIIKTKRTKRASSKI
jgi:hypothetical protein